MIEAVVNVSEGRDERAIATIGAAAGNVLLDVHSDPFHHRSVFTLAGEPEVVEPAALALARQAVELLDISTHTGVHPRLGVVDVVPFVPYDGPFEVAVEARSRFAEAFGAEGVPCFCYGPGSALPPGQAHGPSPSHGEVPGRTLPDIRREAFVALAPDTGPPAPHATAGATCVGARPVLVAYNLVVDTSLSRAKEIARSLRGPQVRALAFALGQESQVSFNLIEPDTIGPEKVYDLVARLARIDRAELVGLIPERLLSGIPVRRLPVLGLSTADTIEARLEASRARGRERR